MIQAGTSLMTFEDENTEPIPVILPEPDPGPRRVSGVASVIVTGIMLLLTTVLLGFALKPLGFIEVAGLFVGVLAAFISLLFLSSVVIWMLYEMGRLIRWLLRRQKSRGRHSR